MPRVKKHKARTDIYQSGLITENKDNKQGYSIDRSKPENDNDRVIVKKGQEYYSWKFRHGGVQISLSYPKRQQLTQSGFLTQLYDIEDWVGNISANDAEDLQSIRDDIVQEIENLMDETQGSLDNMPEQLQYSPTGELLQERIDGLEGWKSDLEAVDLDDYDEPEDNLIIGELDARAESVDELDAEEAEGFRRDHQQEWIDSKIQELQDCSSGL